MKVTFNGVRGSIPTPGPRTSRYGGNTSSVEVSTTNTSIALLDAGTGIRSVDCSGPDISRVDILLTHLHMDHILGLGFFGGFYRPDLDVHIWGPASTVAGLRERLNRYMSPPLFPVRLRDLPCRLTLHDVPLGTFEIPGLSVTAMLIIHPGTTVGYRLFDGFVSISYLPDHEPALGSRRFPEMARWTSGYDLMAESDVLIHDCQYTDDEYPRHVGWGHSSIEQTVSLAEVVGVRHLIPFHHDPGHDDDWLDQIYAPIVQSDGLLITPAREAETLTVPASGDSRAIAN